MWLLNCRTFQLKFFVSPEKVYGGYAILSHCWGDDEQSFKDLRKIHKRCSASGTDPRDHICEKIRRCCELVRRHGHVWVWIDTCCIDKTSSAELSEAINSMYRYYAMAKVCYAYLHDVPTDGAFTFERGRHISPFARSRWHRRGWTLQELIAPRFVLLISNSWDVLGSKADLAEELESITGVPATVLRLEERAQARSVAERMSWASRRETTREEDEAYCLLGLFGIHMPTLYGEGRQAFRRLQEEILRTSPDTTLFAWRPPKCIFAMTEIEPEVEEDREDEDLATGLFAARPSDFCRSRDIGYASQTHFSTNSVGAEQENIVSFSITPHGVRARLPCFVYRGRLLAHLNWYIKDRSTDVDQRDPRGIPLFLLLKLSRRDRVGPFSLYHVVTCAYDSRSRSRRIIELTHDEYATAVSKYSQQLSWHTLYVSQFHGSGGALSSDYLASDTATILPMDYSWSSPVRISNLTEVNQPWGDLPSRYYKVKIAEAQNVHAPWTGQPPARITFRVDEVLSASRCGRFVLQLGKCFAHSDGRQDGSDCGCLWANIQPEGDSNPTATLTHKCPEDHILRWSHFERTFTVGTTIGHPNSEVYQFTLSFQPCRLNPTKTLAMQPIGICASPNHLAIAESDSGLFVDSSDRDLGWEDVSRDLNEVTSAVHDPTVNSHGILAIGSTAPLSFTRSSNRERHTTTTLQTF